MHPLERHLSPSHPIDLSDVPSSVPVTCIDGRRCEPSLGVPGGSAGLFLHLVHALETIRGVQFEGPTLEALLSEVARRIGTVYLHSDAHAANAVSNHLDEGDDSGSVGKNPVSLLKHPPAHLQEPLLELLGRPEFIGCGHLRMMSEHPESYGIRADLVSDFLRAFFRVLWHGNPNLLFQILEGAHQEIALLHVHADPASPGIVIPGLPCVDDEQCFIHHPDAARVILRDLVGLLVQSRRLAGAGVDDVFEQLWATYLTWLAETARRLAAAVPQWDVSPSAHSLQITPAVARSVGPV